MNRRAQGVLGFNERGDCMKIIGAPFEMNKI